MVRKTTTKEKLELIAQKIKVTTLDISYDAHVGHLGSALSIVEMLTAVYFGGSNISKENVKKGNRDRFILSKGHAAAALYATLFCKKIISKNELTSFGKDYGLCEHPEILTSGIEMSSGSLGHGISYGIGLAIGLKRKNLKNKVFVLISDGEMNEGGIWEAALFAPTHNLNNLIVLLDNNGWQCFGKTKEIVKNTPLKEKWEAFGWDTHEVDGHNTFQIIQAINKKTNAPKMIIANTISGHGISVIENKLDGHYKTFDTEEYAIARKELLK